jgi:aldehyde:ferredoxin oxidoreductase
VLNTREKAFATKHFILYYIYVRKIYIKHVKFKNMRGEDLGGYMGKILWVDLNQGKLKDEPLNGRLCRSFIGGYGLGARIIFSRQEARVNPLGPDNILGFVTGPLTGTSALSGTRFTVVGKSPLTGGWGDANSGGFFGAYMKFSGYDGVFFTGQSNKPVYLFINNGKAEIHNAEYLWGKDCYETEDTLRSELGKNVQVACIGPAGEKLSLISAIIHHKARAAARCGLGAVMGSKKLKAIAVMGNMEVPVSDKTKVKELRQMYINHFSPRVKVFTRYGTPGFFIPHAEEGDAPTKNWLGYAVTDLPTYKSLGADAVIAYEQRKFACYLCPISCGGLMKQGKEYMYEAGVHKPEYETLAMFGSNLLNDNLESIIKVNDICNRFGIDTISAGATMAFTIECFENGLLTEKDTDGLEMTWGNHKAIVAMMERLAKREGFGSIIADGVMMAVERMGKGEESAVHVGGMEVPAHTPLVTFPFAVSYRLEATPARHTQFCEHMHPPGLFPEDVKPTSFNGEKHKRGKCFLHSVQASGMCLFIYGNFRSVKPVVEFLNAVTGWNVPIEELVTTGERIANIRQAFNIREGLNPLKFKMPERLLGRSPYTKGPLKGITIDEATEQTWIEEYLSIMDWDLETAKPSKNKLYELGLKDVADQLYK